ncbi:MAG: hypothetical protein LBK83_03725 [Treponema sp.]|jgi:hypothetical protein|nr:hypothetical protein [Treponema sp.]
MEDKDAFYKKAKTESPQKITNYEITHARGISKPGAEMQKICGQEKAEALG